MTLFDPFPTLDTPRLLLRALTQDDFDTLLRIQTDPRVIRYFGRAALTREQMQERMKLIFDGIRDGTSVRWGLELRETGALVGTCGFWRWNKEHHFAEVGYELTPEAWGRGLMPEALRTLCRYAFEKMGLHRVEATVDPENAASIRTLEKVGFVREALLRENWFFDGRYTDSGIYGLLASDLLRAGM